MSLKTTYTDSAYTQKEYQMNQLSSGYVTLEDVTVYSSEGDFYGCEDLNKQNYEYNKVASDFDNVQALITKLRSVYGITVSNNPNSIVDAITLLASSKYTTGKSNGISYVRDNAHTYNLRTDVEYGVLTNKVQTAYNAMSAAIPYFNSYTPITGSFSDPIKSAEASAFKTSTNSAIDGTRTPYTTYKATAIANIDTAVNALTV